MNLYDFTKASPDIIRAKRRALLNSPVYLLAIPKVTKNEQGEVEWEAEGQFTVECNGIVDDEQVILFLRYMADWLEAQSSGVPPTEDWRP